MNNKEDPIAGPEGQRESLELATFWHRQIESVKDFPDQKRWVKRGETIEKRYRDERSRVDEDGQRRCNSLWSNIEILRPALYGKAPLPVAERKFRDRDPVGRGAAQILERALRAAVEETEIDEAFQQAVTDYLLPGRGVVWVRYEPEFGDGDSLGPDTHLDMNEVDVGDSDQPVAEVTGEGPVPEGDEDSPPGEHDETVDDEALEQPEEEELEKLQATGIRLIRESVLVDYVPWPDFYTLPVRARTWNEVTAVAKRVYMTRDQLKARFGKEIGKAIPLQKDERGHSTQNTAQAPGDQDEKGEVFEIWNKDDRTVYWIATGYQYLCDKKEDPLRLKRFFPVPRPLYANATTNTLIPVPDYIEYQDQAIQIDELSQRIAMLTKACKIAGVYNANADGVQRLFNESVENELIPVDDWAAFAEKGGVQGAISLVPVKEIIGVLNELMQAKALQVQEMDRLTGINDIMRGTTDARETLGGLRLKTNNSGTRLTRRQNEIARFARDTVRLMAEIMSEHFSPQSLIDMSGALYEEGLGPDDMPSLTALQQPPQAPPVPPGQPPMPPPPQQSPGPQPPAPGQPAPPVPMMPPQPQISPADMAKMQAMERIIKSIQLIKDEKLLGFRVDIEVDSTIFGDAAQEKADRTEFITATTTYLQTAMMMGAQMPEIIPLLGKFLQFGVRGHRVGRDLEVAIEDFCDEAVVAAKQRQAAAASQPTPDQMKMQIEMFKAKTTADTQNKQLMLDQQRAGAQIASAQQKTQADAMQSKAEIYRQGLENAGEQANAQLAQQKADIELQMKLLDLEMEKIRMQTEIRKMEMAAMQPPKPPVSQEP